VPTAVASARARCAMTESACRSGLSWLSARVSWQGFAAIEETTMIAVFAG
jgi:hypothetical protein